MKLNLELNVVGDGRIFLNYWDGVLGNDVVVQVIGDRFILENTEDDTTEEISFHEYVQMVEESERKAYDHWLEVKNRRKPTQ